MWRPLSVSALLATHQVLSVWAFVTLALPTNCKTYYHGSTHRPGRGDVESCWKRESRSSRLVNVAAQHQHKHLPSARPLFSTVSDPAVSNDRERADREGVLDVAIVGAGPAGLTLAIALKEKGLSVGVFEANPELTEGGAAVFIQSFGLATLNEIKPGLADDVVALGRPVECIHLTRPDGSTIARLDMTVMERSIGYPFLGVTRYAIQSALLQHLSDEDLHLGCRLAGIDECGPARRMELRFEDRTEKVRARAVVGADGRRSMVRKEVLAPDGATNDWALTWWALADVENTPVPKGEFRMSYTKGQAIYYGEVQDGLTMWTCTKWTAGDIERDPALRADRALQALTGWPEEVTDMVKSTSPSKLIEVFVGDVPLQWHTWSRQPAVTLIGDAAHAMLPSLGMGVTSAFQDVAAMVKCIDGPETELSEALLEYERKRRIPATLVQLASRIATVLIKNILCA